MEIYIAKSGKEAGPFTKEQVAGMLESGMVDRGDSVWHEGLPAWIQVYEFLGLRPPVPVVIPDDFEPTPGGILPKVSSRSGAPAPFERRVRAHLVDLAVCLPVSFGLGMLTGPLLMAIDSRSVATTTLQMLLLIVAVIVPSWLYHAFWESSSFRATPGKMLMGLVVTDLEGHRLRFSQASRRALRKVFSQFIMSIVIGMAGVPGLLGDNILIRFSAVGLLSGIVFLSSLKSSKGQCLHDLMSKCIVVVK